MRRAILVVVGFTLFVTPASTQSRMGTTADEAAIQQNQDTLNVALNQHDAKATAATFANDADWVSPAGYRSGRAEIETIYARLFTGVDKNANFKVEPLKIRFLTPGVAVGDADAVITGTTKGTVKNHGTAIFVKRSDGWTRVALRVIEMSQP
jgi:uncharacterized protein (TIGR02246 family)